MIQADVVIVGGGIVGGLAALLLAEEPDLKIVLIDQQPEAVSTLGMRHRDPRVWAMSPANIALLKRVGVWSQVDATAPYYGMQVWQRDGAGELWLGQKPDQYGLTAPIGAMVEPAALTLPLQQQIKQASQQITFWSESRLQHADWLGEARGWRLSIQQPQGLQIVTTPLLIGADGAQSGVRMQAGIGVDVLDYQQTAISAAIKTALPHGGVARQIYHGGHPLALLPMANLPGEETQASGHWLSVVWSLPAGEATYWLEQPEAKLAEALTQASNHCLGDVISIAGQGSFPLKAAQAHRYVKPNLALIGDAAHTIHPMAGQGANLGCLDTAVLVDVLRHDRARGAWAQLTTLYRYERRRRLPDALMMHSMSALGFAFDLSSKPLQVLRSMTIEQLNQQPALKAQLTAQASGWPDLAQTRYRRDVALLP